jgi:hypothetical protein
LAIAQEGDSPRHDVADWSQLVDYETLLTVPEVRWQIDRHSAQAEKRLSGEEFLKKCDLVFAPVMGGVSMAGVASICQPLYAKLGIKTGKSEQQTLPYPAGRTIVAVLCSLARQGQQLNKVTQADDGCMIEATIPSDIWSFAGELVVTVVRQPVGTLVEAAATIPGQKFDWGKSSRTLERLFADLQTIARAA